MKDPAVEIVLRSHPVDWILFVSLAHSLGVRPGLPPGHE